METRVAAGDEALEAGNWTAARDCFRDVLEEQEVAEAVLGLAEALWWLGDIQESVACRERAYALFRRRPEPGRAADIALTLSIHHRANLGNAAAAAGWLSRAARLVEECQLDDLRGWVALMQAGTAHDPVATEGLAREAREHAAAAGDLDLELCALAQMGASLVKQGRIEEGLAALDEAMAGSLGGEGGDLDTVVFTSCNMISSCVQCAEFERAVQWVRAADRFTERYGCPFLYVYCRSLYGSVLVATGDWPQAERELEKALRESRESQPVVHALACAALAELRLAQGRLEDAERLVAGLDDVPPAAPVLAAIHLARGNPAAAAATAARALDAVGEDWLERALLGELLGQAELARGDAETPAERGRELAELGAELRCRSVLARGERLIGQALAGADAGRARRHLEAALAAFVALGTPLEAARTRLLLAGTLSEAEPGAAESEARAALAAFEDLGAGGDADAAAAFLRGLGVRAARAGPKGIGSLTKREREVLVLLGEGLSNPEIAKRLVVSRKTVEHHVAHVLAKLGARSRTEAAAEAVRRLHGGSASE